MLRKREVCPFYVFLHYPDRLELRIVSLFEMGQNKSDLKFTMRHVTEECERFLQLLKLALTARCLMSLIHLYLVIVATKLHFDILIAKIKSCLEKRIF